MSQERLSQISNSLNEVAAGVSVLQEDVKQVKADLHKNRENIDILLSNQDWMIRVLTRLDQERLAMVQTLTDHTERIERLEAKPGLSKV